MPPPAIPDAVSALLDQLSGLDAGAVLLGDAVGPGYARDGEPCEGARPALVLRPRDAGQASAILSAARALRQPLVIQGGRTGLAGGARPLPGEVSLSTERMTGISDIDPLTATVTAGAGTPLEKVQDAARDAGMYFGVDLGARGTATIGGTIATNAGGIRVLRYGMMREQVAGLEIVLADGGVINGLDRPPKDNAGPDLRPLFIGSEGTLGLVTRARLRLHPAPRVEGVAFVSLPSLAAGLDLLARLRSAIGPVLSAFEVIDPALYAATVSHLSLNPPLAPGAGFYAMIEFHGTDPDRDPLRFQQALGDAIEAGAVADAVLAASGREIAALWRIRDGLNDYLFSRPNMAGYDMGLPLAALEPGLAAVDAAVRAADAAARPMPFGHIGDGNLHYMVQTCVPDAVARAVFTAVAAAGGTISAEHGIGRDKTQWLPLVRGSAERAALARLKAAFDPGGILNPGRILGAAPLSERPDNA